VSFTTELRRPAVLLWLAAVAGLGFKWLSPLGSSYENAILADVVLAGAALARLLELPRRPLLLGRPHAWLAAYVAYVALSAIAAPDHSQALKALLIVTELAVFAVLTADLAREDAVARAFGWVVLGSVVFTSALAIVGLVLFYAGHTTALIGTYGEQFEPSRYYARIAAGFASPPLLGSWCVVMAAVVAWPRAALPRRWVLSAQVALVVLAAATLSRPLLAVLAVLVIQWAAAAPTRARTGVAVGFVVGATAVLAALTVGRLHLDPTRPADASYVVPDPGNRREAAATSWHTLREHPVLGLGPGSYPGRNRGQPFRAHLTPLNIAATEGLLAVAALAGLVACLWRRRERPLDVALWSGAAGLALDGLTQDVDHFRHVWLLIGLLMIAATSPPQARRSALGSTRAPHRPAPARPDPAGTRGSG
jgi:hypothetical protein